MTLFKAALAGAERLLSQIRQEDQIGGYEFGSVQKTVLGAWLVGQALVFAFLPLVMATIVVAGLLPVALIWVGGVVLTVQDRLKART